MILKGEKTILRPVKINDAPRFVKWLADAKTNRFMQRRNVSLKEEKGWILRMQKSKRSELFAIDTKKGIHIGRVVLDRIDKKDKNAELIIIIGRKYWGNGYGTDATKVMLTYGFEKLKLHRIGLWVYDFNLRAIKMYKKLGFQVEGKKRECVRRNGKFYDAISMGILDREWEQK